MKVALVAPEFPPDIGGVQTYAWNIACELTRLGHEVRVFTAATTKPVLDAPFVIEPALKLRRRHDRSIINKYRADIWHCMNAPYAWLALDTAPVFVTVHGNDFLNMYHSVARLDLRMSDRLDRWIGDKLTKQLMRWALPRTEHIFTNSRYTEHTFLKHYPSCSGKTSVASVGIAEENFEQHKARASDEPARLVSIARLDEPRKNITVILEALAELQSQYEFHYTVIGDGLLRPNLESMATTLGLDDRVTFTGFSDDQEKRAQLRTSDLFVLPTLTTPRSFEGFGLVYLEANACGTPALGSPGSGAAEAIEEGISGYFVEAPTKTGITAALSAFLRGEIKFDSDVCQAHARCFSWKSVAEHCVARYKAAMESGVEHQPLGKGLRQVNKMRDN